MNQSTVEVWRGVVGYEDWYQVSSLGNVKRIMPGRGARLNQFLARRTDRSGYLQVSLGIRGKNIYRTVHSLVAEAFIGPRPGGYTVNHKDGVKQNNDVANLEYFTDGDNIRHAHLNGLVGSRLGEGNSQAKLTWEKARDIRARAKAGESRQSLATEHGVSLPAIAFVIQGRTWKENAT